MNSSPDSTANEAPAGQPDEAALREAQKDSVRLDWLQNNEGGIRAVREKWDDEWTIWFFVEKRRKKCTHPNGSVRGAIDDAMNAAALPKEGAK